MGTELDLILPSGVNPFPWIETYDPRVPVGTVSGTTTVDTAFLARLPRLSAPLPITQATYYVAGTSAGNVDIALFRLDGSTYTLVASTGMVAAGSINDDKTVALTAATVVMPGLDYYAGFCETDGTLTIARTSTFVQINGVGSTAIAKANVGALVTISSGTAQNAITPWIRFS